ncbi:hypothetical protein LTR27_005692 [Elasticomyces elasticus]|nr:hypothetical protein LTR27_005692 [Elasticomyces elasticus]
MVVLNRRTETVPHVKIILRAPSKPDQLIDTVSEARIREHSATIDGALAAAGDGAELTKTVYLSGGAPAALDFVIHRIAGKQEGRNLHIKVHDMPLVRAAAVFEAVEVLKVRPAQSHIEGHVVGYISHDKVTPDEMMAVTRASYPYRNTIKIFNTLVQQVAWGLVHGKYDEVEANFLHNRSREFSEFCRAVTNRMWELKAKKNEHDARSPDHDPTPIDMSAITGG